MEGRSYLTTQNQPFALSTFDASIDDVEGPVKGLCGYRMISMDYKFYMDRESSDEQLGVPGRVFNHGFPESTPNVEYYPIKEELGGGMAAAEHHLRKGQGVIGRAFYSPNVLLCKDVTQLSIIDYPLAHYARDVKLGGCFAICLQSSCTGNDTYVLECFMPPSNKDYYGLVELQQQIAKRLHLEAGSYYVNYKDEEDHIHRV
ncbi:hypothetical protein ACSBR1_038885 [Camellia fascicularis]